MMRERMKTVTGREIAALLHPRLAVLVTCCDKEGTANLLTVAWHTPLSHEPPLLGISIAPARFSHGLIQETAEFAVNIVGPSLRRAVEICGERSGREVDKFNLAGLETQPAKYISPPVLSAALGVIECRVVQQVETGDHTFFVGEALHGEARMECFSNAWERPKGVVLQCLQRDRYGHFVEEPDE